MKIIAVMNQKGGIGKTMTAAAIAYIMGEEKGKKVLICDADQQGNIYFFTTDLILKDRECQNCLKIIRQQAAHIRQQT